MVMVLAMTLVFATGCSFETNVSTTKTESHIKVCSQEEMVANSGINLNAPEGAESVEYSYCEGDVQYAEAKFEMDGATYIYRAQFTDATDYRACTDGTIAEDDDTLTDAVSEGTHVGVALVKDDISLSFNEGSYADIQGRDGIFLKNDEDAGLVTWIDVVPGVLYTLTVDQNCDAEALVELANNIFEPMQGDAE